MKAQEEQFIQVFGTIHDPYNDFEQADPFASLEIFDEVSVLDEAEDKSLVENIKQKLKQNHREDPSIKQFTQKTQ